jgi:hypothetical protein
MQGGNKSTNDMMSHVLDGIVNLLAAEPGAALPPTRIGDRVPATTGELPSLSVSVTLDLPRGSGLGTFLREGHQLVQNSAVITVSSTPDTFLSDLKTLRILPLPLKRNPASHSLDFSDDDVSVSRSTDPNNPVKYRLMALPAGKEEFSIDVANALIQFGAPQSLGDKLEVVHWTLAFRDDIVVVRHSGLLSLDAWGKDAAETNTLSRAVQQKLAGQRDVLRAQGFAILNPISLSAASSSLPQPAAGSAFGAWKQTLAYRFAFEIELGGQDSAGVAIRRIDIHANDSIKENFTVPAAP